MREFQSTLELVDSLLRLRDEAGQESQPREDEQFVERRARVTAIDGQKATLEFDDGAVQSVDVPARIGVGLEMPVRVLEYADGRVLYLWE